MIRSRNKVKPLSAPYHFPRHKTSFTYNYNELELISLILQATGCRISEILSLMAIDLIYPDKLHLNSLKRSVERTIDLDPYLYKLLSQFSRTNGKIFSMPYFKVYRWIKKGMTGMFLIKNKVRYSVCHSARKHYIRHQIYNLKKTVQEVVEHIGWQSKTSILYYLK